MSDEKISGLMAYAATTAPSPLRTKEFVMLCLRLNSGDKYEPRTLKQVYMGRIDISRMNTMLNNVVKQNITELFMNGPAS
jgi:hypothetical protein